MIEMLKLDLQLFDDGGDAAAPADSGQTGAGDGGSSQDTADESVAELTRKRQTRRNPLANVRYGKQPSTDTAQAEPQTPLAKETQEEPDDWETVRNGKYKAQFDADVQRIVQDRLKNSKQSDATLEKLAPMLQNMATKYGLKDASNIDELMSKYNDDDELYEQEAMERGLSVSTLKQIKSLEREHEANEKARIENEQRNMYTQHLTKLAAEGEKLKQVYPSFDLRTELQNPLFARLTAPNSGIDLATAFYAVHRNEIQPQAMAVGAQMATQKIAQSIQSGRNRPAENGARSAAVDVRDDPRKLTKQDR